MRLIYSDASGNFYDHPEVRAVGRTGDRFLDLGRDDLVELPSGSSLVLIPGGRPVGITPAGRFLAVDRDLRGPGPAYAVGALLPQGYTRTFWPAYRRPGNEPPLPLYGYAAVAWSRGKVYAAAVRTEKPGRWDPARYNTPDLPGRVEGLVRDLPGNRIVRHLAGCALEYRCFTAQNIFYRRWEGGIPVSRSCNAGCLGCISLQPAGCCPAPQSRITFTPSEEEVADLGSRHLEGDGDPIISFGQGCEGEPTLAAGLIGRALGKIRAKTSRGTVNINTNAGNTENFLTLARAGLDSARISLISAREEVYRAYHRPRGYGLADVRASVKTAGDLGVYTSLNLLVSPGLTDREEEVEALLALIRKTGVKMVQLRNLNIDPDFLFARVPPARGELIGIPGLAAALKSVPGLALGGFSRPVGRGGK